MFVLELTGSRTGVISRCFPHRNWRSVPQVWLSEKNLPGHRDTGQLSLFITVSLSPSLSPPSLCVCVCVWGEFEDEMIQKITCGLFELGGS